MVDSPHPSLLMKVTDDNIFTIDFLVLSILNDAFFWVFDFKHHSLIDGQPTFD